MFAVFNGALKLLHCSAQLEQMKNGIELNSIYFHISHQRTRVEEVAFYHNYRSGQASE